MSTRRSALQTFTFSDGTRLEKGDWACTPVHAIMTDATQFPRPLEFSGFRFIDPEKTGSQTTKPHISQPSPSKLTDANDTFHVWGTGRMTWYVVLPPCNVKPTTLSIIPCGS